MTLPSTLKDITEWNFVGPMGPDLPEDFKTRPTLAVDGGAHFVESSEVWVGDADSYQKEIRAEFIISHPVKKTHSDLALALGLSSDHFLYKFHFWGFLGERKDHELFNLGESNCFLEKHPEAEIIFYDQTGKIRFHFLGAGMWKFHHVGLFSLGTLKKVALSLKGNCEYPILHARHIEPLSSLGLSNVGKGDIKVEAQGPFFIYYPEGKS